MSVQPTTAPIRPSLPDLLRSAATDQIALASIVEAEQDRMRTWLVHVLRDNHLAEDALQETWLILSRGQWRFVVHSSDGDGDVRAWLRQVALRAALRLRERATTHRRILSFWRAREPAPLPAVTPLEHLEEQDRGVVAWAAVSDLPQSERVALELRFRDGLDFAAIGRVQGCSALTARVRTWRGLSSVRRRLGVLGLFAMPGLVRAALSAGGRSGAQTATLSGFSAGFVGLDPRLVAGVGVISLGLIALGAAWYVRSETNEEARDLVANVESVINSPGMTNAGRPVWEWVPPAAVEGTPSMEPSTEATATDTTAMPQIGFGITFIEARDVPFPSNRLSILTANETSELLTRIDRSLAPGKMMNLSEWLPNGSHSERFKRVRDRRIIAGYQRRIDGIDPVLSNPGESLKAWVSGRAEGAGILLTQVLGLSEKPLAFTEQQAVWTDRDGRDQNLVWEEVTSLSIRSAAIPDAGVMVSMGSSLLLPSQPGSIVRSTPSGVVSQAGSPDGTWWMLIMPTVVEGIPKPQPGLPKSPISEPSIPAIPSATG